MSELPATELLPLSDRGRRFAVERRVRLGDVDARGELRLDAVARYLQDVASDDALAADLPNAMGWLVRRSMIRVDRPGGLNEDVSLTTWCTGAGRSWAERRTSIRGAGAGGAAIEAVSLWVQVDPTTGRPARLGEEFDAIYAEAAGGRVVSSKLTLPRADDEATTVRQWSFRRTDHDPFDHVNNAAQWTLVEELLGDRRRGTGELEYLAPADAGVEYALRRNGDAAWLVGPAGTVSALRWLPSRD